MAIVMLVIVALGGGDVINAMSTLSELMRMATTQQCAAPKESLEDGDEFLNVQRKIAPKRTGGQTVRNE
jgi:hypothetical protein